MTHVIGVVGFIGSGKDTVTQYLVQHHNAVRDSFAAPLKDMVSAVFGWPRYLLEGDTEESREFRETPDVFWTRKTGIPHFTPRLALQLVGTEVMRNHFHTNIWLSSLEYRLCSNTAPLVVISDARFQNELQLIRELNGTIIMVTRGDLPEWYDVAVSANAGDAAAKKVMQTKYADIHRSEWDWAGTDCDYTIHNNGTLEELYTNVQDMVSCVMCGT